MPDKRKRKRKPYSLKQVRIIGSHALMTAENVLLTATNNDQKLRAANTIGTLLNSYARLTEAAELENRVDKLELSLFDVLTIAPDDRETVSKN